LSVAFWSNAGLGVDPALEVLHKYSLAECHLS
jgi:hypothetical protein